MSEEEGWIQALKALFFEIWIYILIIAVGILLFIGLLLGIWYSLCSDRSYRYRKRIKPSCEIESASVFVGSRVRLEEDQLPPYPKSPDQELPPPAPSLLLSASRTSGKYRSPDDGYSSEEDSRRSVGRRHDKDHMTEPRARKSDKMPTFTDLGYGIIETHNTIAHQRQTSTLDRFALRNNGESSASSLPNRHTSHHDDVFTNRENQPITKRDPNTLDGRNVSVSPNGFYKSPSSPLIHHNKKGGESLHLGNHDNRLSSNIDNTIETRLSSNSNRHNSVKTNTEKVSNANVIHSVEEITPISFGDGIRNTIYQNRDGEEKSYINTEKSYLNNEFDVPEDIHYTNNNIAQVGEIIYVNQAESIEEDDEDFYTEGFSPPLQPQLQNVNGGAVSEEDQIYQNNDVNQQTYHNYDTQVYANNESARDNEENFSHLKRDIIYENHVMDETTDEDDEFMDIEDIYINQ